MTATRPRRAGSRCRSHARGFDFSGLAIQLVQIVVFVPLVLFGMSFAAEYLLKKVERVKEKPAKNKLEFLGSALFIPFFIVTGFLIDPLALARSLITGRSTPRGSRCSMAGCSTPCSSWSWSPPFWDRS